MQDLDKAWADLKAFIRKLRKQKIELAYVAVPERQKRGAIHWHLAIRGYYAARLLRDVWRSVAGDGNLDVTSSRQAIKDPRVSIAGYIAKYVSKEPIAHAKNRQRFASSRNFDHHAEETVCVCEARPKDVYRDPPNPHRSVRGV